MSLTSSLRPTSALHSPSAATASLGDHASLPFTHQPTYITLHRMLIRFQHIILLQPPTATLSPLQEQVQRDLRSPLLFHRSKWLHNVEYARTLLLQLEHSARVIKVQRTKRDILKDLAEKRVVVKRLRSRIEEIGREVDSQPDEEKWKPRDGNPQGETLEQMLGLPPLEVPATPEHTSRDVSADNLEPSHAAPLADNAGPILSGKPYGTSTSTQRDDLFATARRRRGGGSPNPPPHTAARNSNDKDDVAATSGFSSLASTEKTLLADSRTQEALTSSLVSGVVQLKQSALNVQAALGLNTGQVGAVLDGLEKNIAGLDAASRGMRALRRVSEGQGWLGRMKLYAMIFGMWIAAIMLVFVGPKFRF